MESTTSLGHIPDNKWAFDESVTACFEDMLQRSIPQYDIMRQAVFTLGCHFVHPGGLVVDLGCSRGDALWPFVVKYGTFCRYLGVEVSEPMIRAAQARFHEHTASDAYGNTKPVDVEIKSLDLRHAYPGGLAQLTLAVLTLMFIPIEYRQEVLRQIYAHTVPGGAFIVVEKLLGSEAEINRMMVAIYHASKREHGYSREDVERKRMALEGVLVPMTAEWNISMLHKAGFRHVDCFWRWFNFGAFLAVKDD
jgi:tRNA (cmo5U34)-methyltransferase